MNLGGQSQNFPFSFFHSSAPPAGAVPAASESGRVWGGRSPPHMALSTHWQSRQPARALSMVKHTDLASSHVQAFKFSLQLEI